MAFHQSFWTTWPKRSATRLRKFFRDMPLFSRANWQNLCLWSNCTQSTTKEQFSVCSPSWFKARSSCFPLNDYIINTIYDSNGTSAYRCCLRCMLSTCGHAGILIWEDNVECAPRSNQRHVAAAGRQSSWMTLGVGRTNCSRWYCHTVRRDRLG